jgi:hypothetical protein
MTLLRVLVDGAPLAPGEAREFWRRFSHWMEKRKGDLAGFARAEGLASVHPELQEGGPVLVGSHGAPQRSYSPAAKTSSTKPPAGVPRKTRKPKGKSRS